MPSRPSGSPGDTPFYSRDGVRLATRSWVPRGDPRGLVVLVHGYAEHVARHERLAVELSRAGFGVHGFDQRGHGYSQGARAHVPRFDALVDDLVAFVQRVTAGAARLPLVAFGHSMGGVVVLRAVQTRRPGVDLIVLSSPLLRPAVRLAAPVRALLRALAGPFPHLPTVRLHPSDVSRIPEEREAYRLDPAIHHGPTKARSAREMVDAGALALAEAQAVTVPVLVVHGSADTIADPAASGQLARALPDATLKLFPEGPHELFRDHHRAAATATVLAWLDEHLPSGG